MDSRRRAPVSGNLAQSAAAPAISEGDTVFAAPASVTAEQRDSIARRVAETLQANLERGFLESEEHLRRLAEHLDHIVFLTDAGLTTVLFVNRAYDRIWGRPREELSHDAMAFMAGVHTEDRDRVREVLTGHPGTGYDTEFRVVRPDGEVRWVWVRGFPVRSPDGTAAWIAGIAEDTTDRKRVLASHQQLVRGFTHDVKNPLGAADGHLALLTDGIYGALSPTQLDTVVRARRAIQRALGLVGQMLDIERAQTGTIELQRESFDLGEVLRDLMAEYASAAAARQITLLLQLSSRDQEPIVVYSDPQRVRQIVGNLISNAVKYTQAGGTCRVEAREVEASELPHAPWIAVAVSDNGPGIPPEQQHLLFREFTRFSPASANGSGIGLAISQQLARALGAKITCESVVGEGSTFTLWLPRDRRVSPSAEGDN